MRIELKTISLLTLLSLIAGLNSTDLKCEYDIECKCAIDADKSTSIECTGGEQDRLELNSDHNFNSVNFSYNSIKILDFGGETLVTNRLYLNNNKILSLNLQLLERMPHLRELNLAYNAISSIDEATFSDQNTLQLLNLSNAFNPKFSLSNQLCYLLEIKSLDLTAANFAKLSMQNCSSKTVFANMEQLYLADSLNFATSIPNWFHHIGPKLRILNLKNSSIKNLDFITGEQFPNLEKLIISNNIGLNISALFSQKFPKGLTHIEMQNLGLSTSKIDLKLLVGVFPKLNTIDISQNDFTDDICSYASTITKLQTFIANYNNFQSDLACSAFRDLKSVNSSLIKLEMASNKLTISILHLIKAIPSLQYIDLSHNDIRMTENDLKSDGLINLFANKAKISHINLSFNRMKMFYTYFDDDLSSPIDLINLSGNSLSLCEILPFYLTENIQFPSNINMKFRNISDENDGEDDEEDAAAAKIDFKKHLHIGEIDLSHNKFEFINLYNHFRPVKFVSVLDMSFNPLRNVINLSNSLTSLLNSNINIDGIEWNQNLDSVKKEAMDHLLCMGEAYFDNTLITEIPSLEYACVSKISFANAALSGSASIHVSKFALDHIGYISLLANNLTELTFLVNNMAQLGPNDANFTYVDLKGNARFRCDCEQLKKLEASFSHLRLLSDCDVHSKALARRCAPDDWAFSLPGVVTNRRLVFLIVCICVLITF